MKYFMAVYFVFSFGSMTLYAFTGIFIGVPPVGEDVGTRGLLLAVFHVAGIMVPAMYGANKGWIWKEQ